jgi:hypothetical protein
MSSAPAVDAPADAVDALAASVASAADVVDAHALAAPVDALDASVASAADAVDALDASAADAVDALDASAASVASAAVDAPADAVDALAADEAHAVDAPVVDAPAASVASAAVDAPADAVDALAAVEAHAVDAPVVDAPADALDPVIEELRVVLRRCLKHRKIQHLTILNFELAHDLETASIPDTPTDFGAASRFFSVFFENISNSGVLSRCWPHHPIVYANIFLAIENFKVRMRVFKRIISETCKESCHYEALFAVMAHLLHHTVSCNTQNERDFLVQCMIFLRIQQRKQFPPKPDSKITHLCDESIIKVFEMMKRKHGLKDCEEKRKMMKSDLGDYFNAYWNGLYSDQIRRILQINPTFFERSEKVLERFFSRDIRSADQEGNWLGLLQSRCPDFWKDLCDYKIDRSAKSWILYWYFRHMEECFFVKTSDRQTFGALMTRLVQSGQMSFPFSNPPKLFKKSTRQLSDFGLRWAKVPTSDLLEICFHLDEDVGYVEKTF